jgi:predicted flap endonuclease-1-like 5' DNA nuclease
MATPGTARSLGGREALSAFRAERAAVRAMLRAALAAERAALRAARAGTAQAAPSAAADAIDGAAEEASVFVELLGGGLVSPEPPVMPAVEAEPAPERVAVGTTDTLDTAGPADAADAPEAEPPERGAAATEIPAPQPLQPAAAPVVHIVESPAMPAPVSDATAAQDLSAITELGPGMRLRLAQLGIRTPAQLAAVDPERLREDLGTISRMLRVERWIDAARALHAG